MSFRFHLFSMYHFVGLWIHGWHRWSLNTYDLDGLVETQWEFGPFVGSFLSCSDPRFI